MKLTRVWNDYDDDLLQIGMNIRAIGVVVSMQWTRDYKKWRADTKHDFDMLDLETRIAIQAIPTSR